MSGENILFSNVNSMEDNIEYYSDINPSNIKEIKKRAKGIGFTGRPVYNMMLTNTYQKYLNDKFKSAMDYSGNPLYKKKPTEKYKKHLKEGGYYLKKYNEFLNTGNSFTIDIKHKDNLKKLLRKMMGGDDDILIEYEINGTKKIRTLSSDWARRLLDGFENNEWIEDEESDQEFRSFIEIGEIKEITISKANKKKPSGSFFKYTHNIEGLDLTDFQIYSNINQIQPNTVCCFIQALISAGVDDYKIERTKNLIKTRSVPQCKIDELCIKLELHITINKINDTHIIHYPVDKNKYEFIREQEPIKIGLIEEHYFHIKTVPITRFALLNYDKIKNEIDFHRINKIQKGKYYNRENKFIDSNIVIKTLLDNKDKLLTPIGLCDEIYKTQYSDMFNEIFDLNYTEDNVRLVEYIEKEDKHSMINVFADFETLTDTPIHEAYLCRSSSTNKTFLGVDCGKKLLEHLVKKYEGEENIRLIFHNAAYDLRFIFDYLTHPVLIERGKMLLRGYGKFYYGKNKYINIQIQDSYSIIPEPLKKFKDMFNLPMEKDILPYGLYTKQNVKKCFIPLADCIKEVRIQYGKNNIGKEINKEKEEEFVNDYINNIKKWKCLDDDNLVDIIRYSTQYCKLDVEVLQQGYNKFRRMIIDITKREVEGEEGLEEEYIDINNYVSIPSIAQDFMKYNDVFEGVYELSGNVREFINKCMYGGRTMSSQNKKWKSKTNGECNIESDNINDVLADFDAVSLYPSAMFRLEGFLKGKPKIIKDLNYEFLEKQDGYFVEIIIEKVNKKYNFPLMSKLTKEGIRDWTNDMENEYMHVDKTTLEEIIKYHDIKFKIVRGYYYDEGRNCKLKEVIKTLFDERIKAKNEDNPIQAIYKLLMNSAYGKCLLKPIETETKYVSNKDYKKFVSYHYNWIKDGEQLNDNRWKFKLYKSIDDHFNIVHCGVEVLSMSKRIMNEVMCLAEDLDIEMYYTDTDSIHINNSKIELLADEFKKINNRDLIGKGMGQFHTDFDSDILKGEILAKRSIFLGKKCYIDELFGCESGDLIDYHIRLKGVPNVSILHYCKQNNITPYNLYEKLFEGQEIEFDLTCDGLKCNFKFHNNMTISTLEYFDRKISFN